MSKSRQDIPYGYDASSKDSEVRKLAEHYTAEVGPILDFPVFDHDLGFLFFCSYGKGYEQTGYDKYKKTIIAAADSLATLFNPKVGTLMAWPRNVEMFGGHNSIMDTMMNLEMLFMFLLKPPWLSISPETGAYGCRRSGSYSFRRLSICGRF